MLQISTGMVTVNTIVPYTKKFLLRRSENLSLFLIYVNFIFNLINFIQLHDGKFHVFGLEWTEDTLKFYYDGKLMRQENSKMAIPWVPQAKFMSLFMTLKIHCIILKASKLHCTVMI